MYKIFTAKICSRRSYCVEKVLRVMKLTIVLLTMALLHTTAAGLAQKVSINVENVSIIEVLEQIQLQTSYSFLYNSRDLKNTKPVSLSVKDMSLTEALDKCFKDQPVSYYIEDATVLIKSKPRVAVVERELKKVITGTITDEKGVSLPGVSIKIKGASRGTISTSDGSFTITVDNADAILVFSFIGFEPQERKVGNATRMSIVLKSLTTGLSEVIVVGYGTQKKADVTGSIASINEEAIKSVPASNMVSALQSQAPGLDIQKAGGNNHPGATPSIAIRGQRSLGATNDVLYVVDGIPFNSTYINDLNLDDVTSVQILKDASATAIYGARGANGVILITTRRGKDGAPVVSYSGYGGVLSPLGHYDVMDTKAYETYKKWGTYNANNPNIIGAPNPYSGIDDPKFYTDGITFLPAELAGIKNGTATDWQKLIFKNGLKTNHQLSVSGGTPSTKYAVSAGFYDETGVFPGQSFNRYSFKVSVDQQLGKYVKVGASSLNTVSKINGESINPVVQALISSPLTVPYDDKGNLIPFPGGGSLTYNPLANLVPGAVVQKRSRYNTFTTVYAEAQIVPHLKYRFNGGVEITPETYGAFYGSATYQNLSGPSTARNTNYDYYDYTLENLLIYENTFAKKHHLTATGLFSFQEDYKTSTSFSYNNILADEVQYFNPALGSNLNGSGSYDKFDIVSFMGRVNYDYMSKYLLTLTVRSDGSSTLAPGNKYHLFPSAAVGWNIAQEDFMKNISFLSSLKLRMGYGSVGNAAVNPYQTLGGLALINYNYGPTNVTGTYPNNVPNPKLGWEYTASLNLGLDFGLLNDRITGSVDAYQQRTSDLILPQNLPITTGYTSQFLANIGKTQNKGLEISISSTNIKAGSRKDFGWSTNFNITFNRNKIVALQNGVTEDIGNNRFVGHPINSLYNYVRLGIWQNTAADSALARELKLTLTGAGSVIGTIKVADLNGDSVINSNDRTIVGSREPKFLGGFTNRFSYRGFDLSVVSTYRVGGTQIAYWLQPGSKVNALNGKENNLNVNYWTPNNHENTYPKPNFNVGSPAYGDLLGYYNASYLKIKTINLGYSLPADMVKKIGVKSFHVYSSFNDAIILFSKLHDRFHGIDPESAGTLGVDTPPSKSLLFGLNVTF